MSEPLSMSMFASKEDYWRARCEAAEKDAERYRFLKRVLTVPHAMQSFLRHNNLSPDTKWEPNMDAAIDAAIEKERGNV